MRTLTRGVTLIELLITIVLLGLIAAFAGAAVHRTAVAAAHATGTAATRRSALTLQTLLRHDLGVALDGDVTNQTSTSVQYRRPVGGGAACALGPTTIVVPDSGWSGARLPVVGRDSAFLLIDADGSWTVAAVVGVAGAACGGSPAIAITVDRPVVHPVLLVFEPVRLAVYPSGGKDWLGLAPIGAGTIQPFAGPVVGASPPWNVAPHLFVASLTFAGAPGASALAIVLPPP